MTSSPSHILDAEHAAFITSDGLSINAASAGADGFANLARCLGCRINSERNRIILFLAATPAAAFLADIKRNGRIAAVFCKPVSHRTIQVKGVDAQRGRFPPEDIGRVQRFRETLSDELLLFGEPGPVTLAMLDAPDDDLAVVTFTPQVAFSQTPGPNAGDLLQFRA